jgi:glutamate synthase domain-containing protein 3
VVGGAVSATSLRVTGVSTFEGAISVRNGYNLNIGDNNDLRIYNDGTHSRIEETGSGSLYISGSDINIQQDSTNETLAKFIGGGAAELYYNDSKKFETTGTGVTVTGTLVADQINVSGVSTFQNDVKVAEYSYGTNSNQIILGNNKFRIYADGSNTYLKNFDTNTGGDLYIESDAIVIRKYDGTETIAQFTEGAGVQLNYQGQERLSTLSTGVIVGSNSAGTVHIPSELKIGSVSENQSDGSIFIANSSGVGIGTTNPTTTLQVQGTVSVSSTTTSSEFVGGGSDLRNLSGTHLVSYASHSETSNSALSIAGISTYNQVGILTGSLAVDTSDGFGRSVATSADGKTIIVGASSDEIAATTGTGVVYVLDRVGNSFNQVGILTGSLAVDVNDNFGFNVATSADGKTIIVGAPSDEIGATFGTGVVYVFDRVGNSFNRVGILTGSLAVDANDNFGFNVATSADGKTIIVGAPSDEIGANTSSGVVYVFDRVGNSFNRVGILTGSLAVDASDLFGSSVATSADGKTIIVGARQDEIGANTSSGVAYVFDRVGNSFNQVGILTGSLAVDASDNFGTSVATSADGKTIVVGASSDEIGATTSTGVVYVYDRIGSSFNQVGILTGSLAVDGSDFFGWSVATSADGKTIVVGAYQDEIGATTSTGVAYIFKRQGNSFNQVGILTGSLATNASDNFGISVATSADGKTIIVGASADEIGANTSSGIAYVFDETRDTYVYSGPTGNIGIGTALPTSKLHVIGDVNISGVSTATSVRDSNGNIRSIPQNAKTSAYILAASDVGKHIGITTGGVTVDAGIFSAGDAVSIYNNSSSNQTITQGTSVTMYLVGTATTGNRTLAQRGVATVLCVGTDTFVIMGGGLT